MKKKIFALMISAVMATAMLTGCSEDDVNEAVEYVEDNYGDEIENAVEEATEVVGDIVSDDTWNSLTTDYATLVDNYNYVKEMYESDEVEGNADLENVLNQAADLINQMGEVTKDGLSEENATSLHESMVLVNSALESSMEAMSN